MIHNRRVVRRMRALATATHPDRGSVRRIERASARLAAELAR